MAAVIKPKSAKDKLLDNFRTMLEKSSKGKTKKQLEESEKSLTPPLIAPLPLGNHVAKLHNQRFQFLL
jgi:hypothetical protein